jgi:transcriptional regulator with XRE-family HTH domain
MGVDMKKTYAERFLESPENMRLYQQERAISEITGLIWKALEENDLSQAALAERLGKTKGFVCQILEDGANKTIRTVADVLAALGQELHFETRPIQNGRKTAPPPAKKGTLRPGRLNGSRPKRRGARTSPRDNN